ncbi:MAG: hypothetical protein C4323_05890 [Mastigocladus sp. ERB_26_2]
MESKAVTKIMFEKANTDAHGWIGRWWSSGMVFIGVNLCSFFPLLNLLTNRDIFMNRTPMDTYAHRCFFFVCIDVMASVIDSYGYLGFKFNI